MGKQAADGDSNVAGTVLAEKLGWPIINYAMNIVTADDGKTLEVKRELDTGVATVKVTGPAVLTTSDRILATDSVQNGVTPDGHQYAKLEVGGRYASLKGIMQAKKKPIDNTSAAELGVDGGTTLNYTKFELPPARSGETTFVEDVADLVDKLHSMNKARHEIENKLQDEHDRNKSLSDVVNLKDDLLDKRQQEIEELDKRVNELVNAQATLEAQKLGVEKAFELSKTQLNDRIKSLNEVIGNEKETRELWI